VSRGHGPEVLLEALTPLVARCIATEPPFRPRPAAETALAARALGLETSVVLPASGAIAQAWESARPGDIVLVTGSFYTVGETPIFLRK
jgi:dihydrofolate synthase / folylpolyglutamate synthase